MAAPKERETDHPRTPRGRGLGVVLLLALWLGAGAAAGQSRPEQATGPALSSAELEETIVGNTLHRTGETLGVEWHWAGHYLPEVRMVGRAWWGFGDIDAHGTWSIDDGLWGQFWENVDWSDGGRNCYRVYPVGERLYWAHRRGPHDEDWLFAVRPGNAFDLEVDRARSARGSGEAGEARS